MKKNYFLTVLGILFCFALQAQTYQTWRNDSGTGDNSWQNAINWWNFPNASPMVFGQQEWDNNHLPEQVNSADAATWRFLFKAGASDAHTFTGNQVEFFDFAGDNPLIKNESAATHILNHNIIGDPDATDPLELLIDGAGGLTFGGAINNQGNISINGTTASATTMTFNGVISGTGGVTKENINISLNYKTSNTYSGDTDVNAGTLTLEGSLANSDVSVGATGTLNISENATLKSLTVAPGGIVIIDAGKSLTITNNLVNIGSFTVNNGASLIVNGTSTGNITYNVDVSDTDWHLMSSPVEGEGYDNTWVDNNLIDNTTDSGTNVGISTYDNTIDADGDWVYATDGSTGNFNTGQGYSIKRDATGSDVSFTGTLKVNDASIAITANDIGGGAENRWTLIGNPFSSFIDVDALITLTANATALEDSREALYVWNGTAYAAITTGYIHPGQGFFVNSDVASTNLAINQTMLSHQTGVTFHKNNTSDASINLTFTDGTNSKTTEINYIDGKTKGLDKRFDLGTFNGVSTSFNIFTQLVQNNEGVNFMRQALPNTDLASMIIPVGVVADAGEITFSANATNLASGLKVFLEDRVTNTFTRLDEANTSYKVTLANAVNGIGRFYIHTAEKALSVANVALENVSIYKTDATTLRIAGLSQGKTAVKIFNTLGKQVLNTSFTSNGVKDVTLPIVAKGVYIVQVNNEAGQLNKKIILE